MSVLPSPYSELVVGMSGVLFGYAQLMGKIGEPELIQKQMMFKSIEMMKMFFAALAVSSACVAVMGAAARSNNRLASAWYVVVNAARANLLPSRRFCRLIHSYTTSVRPCVMHSVQVSPLLFLPTHILWL